MSDDLVERVARAMCATHGYEPDGLTYREARAAIAVCMEEAAKTIDEMPLSHPGNAAETALECAAAIRALGSEATVVPKENS